MMAHAFGVLLLAVCAGSELPLRFEPGSLNIFAIADGNGWVAGKRHGDRAWAISCFLTSYYRPNYRAN